MLLAIAPTRIRFASALRRDSLRPEATVRMAEVECPIRGKDSGSEGRRGVAESEREREVKNRASAGRSLTTFRDISD
jgi:hypothetical protein